MDKNSNAKIIQAVFSFLEAVYGKRDTMATSELIRGMIDEILAAHADAEAGGAPNELLPWSRLDHDLRSPMNGILGFTGILLEEITDPEIKWKAEQIQISASRLMQLFENANIYRFTHASKEDALKPVQQESTPETSAPRPALLSRKKTKSAGRQLPNVLIVEDNMVNSNLLQHHIKKYCHVFFSQTGKSAVELAKRERIDAIFMDINLGQGMDGTQAMLEIRKQIGNENLPIVAVTGFAGREERDNFLRAGFNDFITKPFERKEIISIIENLFKLGD